MRRTVFASAFILAASTAALAQTGTAPVPAAPAGDAPTPLAPDATAEAAAGPANLCQELLAFVRAEAAEAAAPPAAAGNQSGEQAATAENAQTNDDAADAQTAEADTPSAAAAEQSGDQAAAAANQPTGDAPAAQTAGAGNQSMPADGEGVAPESPAATESAQEGSGQSGPAHSSPEPNDQQAAEANVENAPLTSSLSAPMPADASPEKGLALSLADAEALAEADDIAACRDESRKLRLSGADMPPPLLALTALDLQYHTTAGQGQPEAPAAPSEPAQ